MQVKRKRKFIMKTKLQILIAVLSIVFSMAKASAQQPQPAPVRINPETGLPEPVSNLDPVTGLPADGSPPFKDANGTPTWIDPSCGDPGKVVSSVQFLGIPLSEVARYLREQFTNYFDIIIPNPNGVNVAGANTLDPTQWDVNLQLKNVAATEIFRAMNLEFELENKPVRWEVTLNGSRPTALLRFLPALVPAAPAPPPKIRKVFFVGDILDEYPGTNDQPKISDVADTVIDAWHTGGIPGAKINIFPPGQLLIVSGRPDQVDFAEQTLRALKEKAEYEKSHPQPQPVKPR